MPNAEGAIAGVFLFGLGLVAGYVDNRTATDESPSESLVSQAFGACSRPIGRGG